MCNSILLRGDLTAILIVTSRQLNNLRASLFPYPAVFRKSTAETDDVFRQPGNFQIFLAAESSEAVSFNEQQAEARILLDAVRKVQQ